MKGVVLTLPRWLSWGELAFGCLILRFPMAPAYSSAGAFHRYRILMLRQMHTQRKD